MCGNVLCLLLFCSSSSSMKLLTCTSNIWFEVWRELVMRISWWIVYSGNWYLTLMSVNINRYLWPRTLGNEMRWRGEKQTLNFKSEWKMLKATFLLPPGNIIIGLILGWITVDCYLKLQSYELKSRNKTSFLLLLHIWHMLSWLNIDRWFHGKFQNIHFHGQGAVHLSGIYSWNGFIANRNKINCFYTVRLCSPFPYAYDFNS